jgi:hypothetical protein
VSHIEKDPLQKKFELTNWIILGIFIILGFVFMPRRFALGMSLGSIISIANFYWLGRDLRKVFSRMSERASSSIMFKYYIRFGVTAVVLFFIISYDLVDVIGLLVGLSTTVIAVVLTTIAAYSKKNCVEEVE